MAGKQFSTGAMLKAVTRTSGEGDVLALDVLRLDGGTQPRAAIDRDVVADYAELMAGGTVFPPVVVYHDGEHYWLADGFHRVHAARAAGLDSIRAEIKSGSVRDAVLYSVGANAAHGLRRTNADKRRSVLRLLEDPEWSAWSDREIARQAGVSNRFVGLLRAEAASVNGSQSPEIRRGGDGRAINTARIGSQSTGRPARRDPNAEAVFSPGASVPAHDPALRPEPPAPPSAPKAAPIRYEAIDEETVLPRGQLYAGRAKVDGAYGAQVSLKFLDGAPDVLDGRTYRVIIVEEVKR